MGSETTYRGTVETGDGGRLLAEQQAALRRVATLVAEGATASELFTAVVEEVVAVLDVPAGWLFSYEPDRSVSVLASLNDPCFPVGSRWQLDGPSLSATILETGQPARIDDYSQLGGTIAATAQESRHGSAFGVPITVDGVVWGLICVGTTEREPLPADTEARLRDFTGLVATAISKAQAHDDLGRLVRQQAALTRVATIVAEGVPAAELFAALTQEVVHALAVPAVSLIRYEADRSTVVLASLNAPDFPVGARLPLDSRSLLARVLKTGRPTRAESELRSEVGVPIVVDGEVWGLIRAVATGPELLRADIEASLRDFTGLVATAISKAESRERLRRVVAEQAALRSVATLVAEGAPPAEVLSSVAREVARILDVSAVSVVRFESDAWSVVVASVNDPGFPVGSRWTLEGPSLNATVFETGKPAQIDYSEELPGPVADAARSVGMRVGVGVPIVVEGRVWGMIAVGQRHRRDALPAFAGSYTGRIVLSTASPRETEARLSAFTELVATAISKAQAHDDLRGLATEQAALAQEQAALRRVATLVARDAPSTEVFESVATEVGRLLDTDITVVGRYDDGAATAIGSWSASGGAVPVGTRSAIGGKNALTMVAETGKPARLDSYEDATGEIVEIARRYGWRSSIAAPIFVEDRLWGVMLVASQRPEPFPAGAEQRLAAFTGLVATAVSNTEARHALERVAAEQAALRRVATLVARGTEPVTVLRAVCNEAQALMSTDRAVILRFHEDRTVTVMAASSEPEQPSVGARVSFERGFVVDWVYETRQAARFDTDDPAAADMPEVVRMNGVRSAVASPIVVDGELWGVIVLGSVDRPFPLGMERRLADFTELVATAIANAESSAELAASRRRIVTASDDARRRIERDLHDGAQQRLVSLVMAVREAEFNVPGETAELREELSAIASGLTEAVESLQELSRGIHPAILSEGGLGSALRTLARRSSIPVDLDIATDARLAEPIEVAAYFVASEALANAAKHSGASGIAVSLERRRGNLLLTVRDNGVGGADAARGSGIVGLSDRVEALGGQFALESPPGRGTTISVELPTAAPAGS
jgi:signal transduction histidine kinase